MKLTILGCFSASPSSNAKPTSQVLEIANHVILIDCGENTQVELRRQKIKFSRIKQIFISHLHGDHFYGLIGLISTFSLLNRKTDLHVYGPKGIKEIILLQLKYGNAYTTFELYFHELTSAESELVFEDHKIEVHTIPLEHRVYTNGYLYKEKPGDRKLNMAQVEKYPIEVSQYNNLKKGKDVVLDDGSIIANKELTLDPLPPRSYAFCSDTKYKPDIIPLIKGVTGLYHESTFLESHVHLCEKTKHATAKQAAKIAKAAEVGLLILGHYSGRYKSLSLFKAEAEEVFDHVALAEDGKVFEFD
ncbi:ribonuclease Z [Gangjinia marincola]|uniref:Ribonuclease Z n=1 Tax=Gangjinia marincola TaxID=578463 RepID=A0ABP3XRY3_9FLAO